ncbi:Fe(2+) transporter permease subunit FeoB [Thiospirochaeta perfilievii]|uniref:Ferrous iron transport protein B n=1 Tax=Thiospirochaeta perfilievii TaxID=252967 RepID=A0A5C1Q9I2_9SPIO|nr:Fe(2+) transporter permease subunit FeoB [Thiospirochaeta perfilievii]QEN04127.1 Fe(2+) transporter permease subunit FeoB [Thiospirochaeta perfilievii]
MAEKDVINVSIVGNPNSGKTTLFNTLTGGNQRVGNWAGVTVERKEGLLKGSNGKINIVDLPGIYSLSASSEDEKVARDYILSGESSMVIDIIDASNIERNLYLLTQLIEMKVPILVVLNMMDLAERKGLKIDVEHIQKHLGCRVIPLSALEKNGSNAVIDTIIQYASSAKPSFAKISYPNEISEVLTQWLPNLEESAKAIGANPNWIGIKLLERDSFVHKKVVECGDLTEKEIKQKITNIEKILDDETDIIIADYKYAFINGIVKDTVKKKGNRRSISKKIDKVVLNKYLGIPIFLIAMFLVFGVTISLGGAFIDFFDILFGTIFVDGLDSLLTSINTPLWVVNILAGGIGAGLQTVATFIPIIFFMFFMLSLLEDSGYMARAAFVMDRFMRAIGLPGKSFIPLIVGFGCTVPAIMATRTLESKRDRMMTIFMAPFMSCGARMPVYALFLAAFFPENKAFMLFSIYMVGIILSIVTGLMLKKTLFKGVTSHFIMELPPYHAPRIRHILIHTWGKLKSFAIRGGSVIIIAVGILGFLNSVGFRDDGSMSFGNNNSESSLLATIGKTVTPVFGPMGIEKENWPATVGIFTGLFAKEAVVGTLSSLYSQNLAIEESTDREEYNFWHGIGSAFASIPEGLEALVPSIKPQESNITEVAIIDIENTTLERLNRFFDKSSAYAYLLFILLYFPCFAALGAGVKELGMKLTIVLVTYLTLLGWSIATLYYQLTAGHNSIWIITSISILGLIVLAFKLLGKTDVAK